MTDLVHWRDNFEAARQEAAQAKRPLVLELYLDGCPHCMKLARETHTDAKVAAALNEQFIPVRLEGRAHIEVVRQLNVPGAPTTIIFSPEGQELHRISGFVPPADYLMQLLRFS